MNFKNIFKTAGLIAIITILSKVIGFFRDLVIAQAYGASLVSDAYFYAYQIPALTLIILGGLGGPFHTVTVSVFSKGNSKDQKPDNELETALNSFLNITGFGLIAIAVMVFLNAEFVSGLIAAGGAPELKAMIAQQLKIMSPIIFIGGVVGILFGISNVYSKFLLTAVSPVVTSIVVMTAVLVAGGKYGGLVLAWATLVGAVFQMLLQIPAYFSAGFKYKLDFDFSNQRVKKIREIILPAALGCTIGQVGIYVDMFFASQLQEGAWSAIGYANRIFQFPVGVLITAMLVPLFPVFSTLAGEKNMDSLRYYFHKGLNSLWFLAFPLMAMLIIFSYDAVKILFERGQFNSGDTFMVSEALFFLSFGIVFYVARDTLTRVFYAFDDTKTPFYIAMLSIFFKAVLNFFLVKPFGIGGITLSTTFVCFINAVILAVLISKKVFLDYSKLRKSFILLVPATLVMSTIALLLKSGLLLVLPEGKIFLAVNILISSVVAFLAYFYIALVCKIDAAIQLNLKIKEKVKSYLPKLS